MKKRIFLFFTIVLLLSLSLQVSAQETLPMIVDIANILTPAEELELETKAQALREEYKSDIVILTVHSLDGQSAQEYADHYYDDHGYGYDQEGSGILFLLAMQEREWYISTCGKAIQVFTDYGIQSLGESSLSYLQSDNYAAVFHAFLSLLPEYFHSYENDTVIDGHADYSSDYYHGTQDTIIYPQQKHTPNLLLSFIIGIAAALASVFIMRSSMNTKRSQRGAAIYLQSDSFHLSTHQDLFLYSNISKVRRQQNHSSGGGSSVHRSSSGRRHGGGGGRF